MASQLITWGLTLALMIFLPRMLGATAVGQFHLANSIWAIVGIVAAFGMDILLTKEIARNPDKTTELLGTAVVLRAIIYLVGFSVAALYVRWAGYGNQTIAVIYVIGVSVFIMQFSEMCRASLQGLERMEFISLADIMTKAFSTVVGLILLFLGQGVLVIAFVMIGASIVSLMIQGASLRRLQPVRFRFDWQIARWILKSSFPYFLVSGFLVMYIQVDIVIISLLVDEEVVGWYGAADSLFATLLFIPSVFITAVFPVLSRMYADESDVLPRLMRKSFDLLALLSIPIGLGIFAIAEPLVVLLFGADFVNSGPVLAVMGIVIILTYQNMLLGRFIISIDRQNAWTVVMALATFATIPLDLVLIPWCQNRFGNGAIGGALAFVVTESAMMIAGLSLLPKGSLGWSNAWTAVRALAAGLGMVAAIWMWRDSFIAIPVIIGVVVYLGLILLLRAVPKEDWVLLGDLAQRILNRFRRRKAEPAGIELKG
ncbi:MAG: flippase [Chloroflexi bacterium]|nr:flippase [Chloroflexota bacterium]